MSADIGVTRVHDLDAPIGDGADIGRRAADIDGDQVVAAGELALGAAANDAAGRPRHQHADGPLRAGFDCRDAAVRLDDPKIGLEAVFRQPALEAQEVDSRLGPNEGVHRGG